MSYNATTKIISRTSSVSVADVQAALGNTSTDLGTLCKASSVNKWSKDKPYRFAKISQLSRIENTIAGTIDERRGNQVAQGIMWGMRFRGIETGMLKGLHEADYSYLKPEGGAASPYRLTDFQGYYHTANCNLTAFIDYPTAGLDLSDNNNSVNRTINVNFNYIDGMSNDYQILIEDFDSTLTSNGGKITTWYPCILIGRYAHCLYKPGNITMTQIRSAAPLGNTVTWFIDLGTTAQSLTDGTAYPGSTDGAVTASVFLVAPEGIADFNSQTTWFDSVGSGGQIMQQNSRIIAVPGAVGIQVKFTDTWNMTAIATVSRLSNGMTKITVTVNNNDTTARQVKVSCKSATTPTDQGSMGTASAQTVEAKVGNTPGFKTFEITLSQKLYQSGDEYDITVQKTNNAVVVSTIAVAR